MRKQWPTHICVSKEVLAKLDVPISSFGQVVAAAEDVRGGIFYFESKPPQSLRDTLMFKVTSEGKLEQLEESV